MDREQLFRNLNELETQLRGIKSATDQVNAVVKADRELAATINAYAQNVNNQVSLLKSIFEGTIGEITGQAKQVIESSSNVVNGSTLTIQSELQKATGDIKKSYSDSLAETKKIYENTLDKTLNDFKGRIENIASSSAALIDLGNKKLPAIVERIKGLVDDSLSPLIKDEMKHVLEEGINSYKEIFNQHLIEIKTISDEVTNNTQTLIADIEKACESLPNIAAISKSESDRVINHVTTKLESTVTNLQSLSQSIVDLKSAIQHDIEVSQQAAEDTVKAIYKLDGLPDYIKQTLAATKQTLSAKLEGNSKSLKNLSTSTKDIKDQIAKHDAKLEDVVKMNKVLLWMVVISMLLTVILKFI